MRPSNAAEGGFVGAKLDALTTPQAATSSERFFTSTPSALSPDQSRIALSKPP